MILGTVLFLTQLAAFPAGPETLECRVWQSTTRTGQEEHLALAVAPAAPWVLAGADTADFRRDTDPIKHPMDVAAAFKGSLQVAASLDGTPWRTCAIYVNGTLIGTFLRPGENGAGQRRHGARVEDAGR